METVTIASARSGFFGLTDFVLLGLSVVLVGLIAYTVISRLKTYRRE